MSNTTKTVGTNRVSFWVALFVSVCYLIAFFAIAGDRIDALLCFSNSQSDECSPLNEVGDFLAGAFAPLAFIWLIAGFIQQGIEIRQQAIELNSLVGVEGDRTKLQILERQPNFEFLNSGNDGHHSRIHIELLVKGECYDLQLLGLSETDTRLKRAQLKKDPHYTGPHEKLNVYITYGDDPSVLRDHVWEFVYTDAFQQQAIKYYTASIEPPPKMIAFLYDKIQVRLPNGKAYRTNRFGGNQPIIRSTEPEQPA